MTLHGLLSNDVGGSQVLECVYELDLCPRCINYTSTL